MYPFLNRPTRSKNATASIGLTKPQSRVDRERGIGPHAFSVVASEKKQTCKSSTVKPISSTSTRGSSSGKPSNKAAESSLPVYNYLEYREPAVAVVYTQCEDEADTLVQGLKG